MRKMFFLLCVLVFLTVALAEELTLNVGETKEFSGNSVKLKNIKSDQAVITVNEESEIVNKERPEDVGPLRIVLKEIFYVGPSEGYVVV